MHQDGLPPGSQQRGGGQSLRLSMNKHGMACSHSVVGNLSLERGGDEVKSYTSNCSWVQ